MKKTKMFAARRSPDHPITKALPLQIALEYLGPFFDFPGDSYHLELAFRFGQGSGRIDSKLRGNGPGLPGNGGWIE